MKIKQLLTVTSLLSALFFSVSSFAQTSLSDAFNKFKIEARADFEGTRQDSLSYGFHGRYFNLMIGGNLGNNFTYYFRQRLRAEGGSIHFFDNTDFLWLNYQPNQNWRFRIGKDAMAVGGYEYDAAPIDEYLVSEYWNNIYCFQLAASAAYITNDGRQTFIAQISQSPYINSLNLKWDAGLLAYNIEWIGSIGNHISTLWSTSLIERERSQNGDKYMNLTMLGTQFTYQNTNLYIDLMHHALSWDDWGNNLGWVVRLDHHFSPSWSLFLKHSFEKNESPIDTDSPVWIDQMVPSGHSFTKTGLGFEHHPQGMSEVRFHCYAGLLSDRGPSEHTQYGFCFNAGLSWNMDILKLIRK